MQEVRSNLQLEAETQKDEVKEKDVSQYPVQFVLFLVEYPFALGKFVFSFGHELSLWYCDVCAAEFAPIVDDVLALELYELHKSGMRTVHGCRKRAHTITSDRPQITFLTCGSWRGSHSRR